MSAPTVRSDRDQLKNVSQTFSAQADAINGMNQNLRGCIDTLTGGDWIGDGAKAFGKEMNDQVMPTLGRLYSALNQSAQVTNQISQLMQQAEDSASKCFHL